MGTVSLHWVTRPQAHREGLPGWWFTSAHGRITFFHEVFGGENLPPCWVDVNSESPREEGIA